MYMYTHIRPHAGTQFILMTILTYFPKSDVITIVAFIESNNEYSQKHIITLVH